MEPSEAAVKKREYNRRYRIRNNPDEIARRIAERLEKEVAEVTASLKRLDEISKTHLTE